MPINASTSIFTDPTLRAGLEKYYENKKSSVINELKEREANPSFQSTFNAKINMPDGTSQTVTANLFTAEMAEKSMVSFDKWLELTAQNYESQTYMMEMAQQRLNDLKAQSPDTSSNVLTTFSANGQLLAYINADGTVVTSNIGTKQGDDISYTPIELQINQTANALGLTGQARIDYLNREIKNALSQEFGNVSTTSYDSTTSPTKREFGEMWYTNFNVDQVYNDALADAQASYAEANSWYQQMQTNLNDMQSFLLSLQEVA